MKKKNVHTLRLNKKSISNLARHTIKGGNTAINSCLFICPKPKYTLDRFCTIETCPSEDCSIGCQTIPVQAQGPCI
jgi:hypothetical protein